MKRAIVSSKNTAADHSPARRVGRPVRTGVVREHGWRFDEDTVRELKERATHDLGIGGPTLAAHPNRAGLVDEYHQLTAPIIAGGCNPFLLGNVCVRLERLDECRFNNGLVYVQHREKS